MHILLRLYKPQKNKHFCIKKSHKEDTDKTYCLFFASFSLRSDTNIAVPQFPLPSVLSTRYRFASASFGPLSGTSEELLAVLPTAAVSVAGNGILFVTVSAHIDSCSCSKQRNQLTHICHIIAV